MYCKRLAEIQDAKMTQKNRHLRTITQLCWAISTQVRHVSTIGKKLVKQQYLLHMSSQYGKLRPTNGWDRFDSLGHPSKFANLNGFCVLPSLLQRHRSPEANQISHDVWPSPGLVHYIYILGILPRASVKLFELGVRTPGGRFLGVQYAGVSIFGVFVRHAFPFSA